MEVVAPVAVFIVAVAGVTIEITIATAAFAIEAIAPIIEATFAPAAAAAAVPIEATIAVVVATIENNFLLHLELLLLLLIYAEL